jgi:CubicO group peptidase (beta-lactamase class C family)
MARRLMTLVPLAGLWLAGCAGTADVKPPLPAPEAPPLAHLRAQAPFDLATTTGFDGIAAPVQALMQQAQVPGLALALIRSGRVVHVQAWGLARPAIETTPAAPAVTLRPDSVMAGASLTKAAFAHLVMQLVDEGVIDLDRPLPEQLRLPLPQYPGFSDLAGDPRWRQVTPRMLLSHSSGLLNWRWINADNRLDFKFAPGERYVYSGEGIQMAQLIVEERTGQALAALMQARIFNRFGMPDTQLVWNEDKSARTAMGFKTDSSALPPRRFNRARAAGSMTTTVTDYANFLAAVLRGEGLSPASQGQMLAPQKAIVSPQQFPSQLGGQTTVNQAIALSAGLGWVVYQSPRGPVFFKEGNDEGTNNFAIGFAHSGDGLLLLANSGHGDKIFYTLVEMFFAPSCLPWFWMGYVPHERPELRSAQARARPLGPDEACLRALATAPAAGTARP